MYADGQNGSGVPDILGPGVMTSVFIQAILATALAVIPYWERRLRRKGIVPGRRRQWVFDACSAIMGLFVESGILLGIWISIAAIILMSRRSDVGDGAQIALAHDIGVFSMNACLLPLLVDEIVHKETKRKNARVGLFALLVVLYIVMGNMAGALSTSFDHPSDWELFCFWDIIPKERMVTLPVTVSFSAGLWLWILVFGLGPTVLEKCWPTAAGNLRRWCKVIDLYLVFGSGFVMWYMLITVTIVRQLLLARSGFNSEDTNMSFGQVLALGTWLPVFLDLGYIFKKGVQGALNDRVPDGWVVVRAEQAALLSPNVNTVATPMADALAPAEGQSELQELLVVDSRRRSRMSQSRTSDISDQLLDDAGSVEGHVSRSTTI